MLFSVIFTSLYPWYPVSVCVLWFLTDQLCHFIFWNFVGMSCSCFSSKNKRKDLTQSWKREPNSYLWLSHLFRIRLKGLCQKTRIITENPGIVILSDTDSVSHYTKWCCVFICLLKPLWERSKKIISNIAS